MKKLAAFLLVFVICFSAVSPSAFAVSRDTSIEQGLATDLKALSLFKGVSDTNFDLNRAPTRTEAIVMLIRILGKENEALSTAGSHPFTDVPIWADKYIAYAYSTGLTNGISGTEFGTGIANADTYITFMLRALGYSDKNNEDFAWNAPESLASAIGILPARVNLTTFWRADVVTVSYAALGVTLKNSSQTLANKLIILGAFTQEKFNSVYNIDKLNASNEKQVLTSEEIFAKCSPSVFYIEVSDGAGKVFASGSGFFLDSNGTAVTNYHVIDGASSAKVTVSDTGNTYDVAGVYDYNVDEDWAIIKVNGSNFKPIVNGSPSTVVGGATVYAIGSPLGLQNTISDGIISNPNRDMGTVKLIQISTPISHGSSGGALFNKYGEVIGITSSGFDDAQNLNFAVPITYIVNASTSALKSFKQVISETIVPINIAVSTGQVTLSPGGSQIIDVTVTGIDEDDSIYWETSNKNVATATFGDWTSDTTTELTINAVGAGTATISVYVDSTHVCNVTVNVQTATGSPDRVLAQYCRTYGIYESDLGCYTVSTDFQKDGTEQIYNISYYPKDNYFFLEGVDYQPEYGLYICDVVYDPATYPNYYCYLDFINNYKQEEHGKSVLNGFTFNGNSQFSLEEITGIAFYNASTFSGICKYSLCDTLQHVNNMLISAGLGIEIYDLGFSGMYS